MSNVSGSYLYFRITPASGKATVHATRVWDEELFLQSQNAHGSKAAKAEDRFTVSKINQSEFQRAQPATR